MMRRLLPATVGVLLAACVMVSAANAGPAPTGTRISIFGGSQTFPANQPFYFRHFWEVEPGADDTGPVGLWTFSLSVDGVPQHGFVDTQVIFDPVDGTLLLRPFLFNFPQRMTGTHVFAGTFSGPCSLMVADGFATGPCTSPNAIVPETGDPFITTVTFVP